MTEAERQELEAYRSIGPVAKFRKLAGAEADPTTYDRIRQQVKEKQDAERERQARSQESLKRAGIW